MDTMQWTILVRFLHIRLKIRTKVFTLLCNILQQYSTPNQEICNKDSRVQVTVASSNIFNLHDESFMEGTFTHPPFFYICTVHCAMTIEQ